MQNSKYEVVDGMVKRTYSKPRRSHTEIMLDMLRVCFSEPVTITEMIHRANMCWKDVDRFSMALMRKGLMAQTHIQEKRLFHTTPEGKKVVFMWNTLRGMLDI